MIDQTNRVGKSGHRVGVRRADDMLVCFYVSTLCCFGYYQKIIKWVIVSEMYVTQDVISSNLALII